MRNAPNQLPNKQTLISTKAILVIGCICFVLTLFIYRPFGLYFLNDDLIHIPWSGKGVFLQQGFLRCVHNLLSFIELKLFGNSPTWFHTICLAMHLVCVYFVYILSKLIFKQYSIANPIVIKQLALLSAIFFMVYAFHSESVLWIIGAVSAMSTCFFLLSLIFYFKKESSIFYLILSLGLFITALLTYENVWVMPVLVWFFWYFDARKNGNYKGWIYPAIIAFVFLVHLYVRIKMIGQLASSYETSNISHFNITQLFLNYNRLLARSLLPPMRSVVFFMATYAIVIVFILWAFVVLIKKKRLDVLVIMLVLCLLVSYLPVISLGIDTHGTSSERYLYLPSVFLCMLLAYLVLVVWDFTGQKRLVLIVIIICFNCFYVLKSSADYHLASKLSKQILFEASNKLTGKNKYEVYGLPSMLNRVKVLDIGFKEGMAWLYGKDSSKIKEMGGFEVTTKSYFNKPVNFKIDAVEGLSIENQLHILLDTTTVYLKPYVHVAN